MKLIKRISIIIFLVLFFSIGSYAQDAHPSVPYIQRNICPFECCQYGEWIVKTALSVYKKEGDTSAIVFKIKPGEKVTALRGNVHIVKLGILVVKKPFNLKNKSSKTIFTKGDKFYVLSYGGEGYYDLWHKGKGLDIDLNDSDQIWANSELVQPPRMIWWVLIKNNEGKQGWLRLKNIDENGFQTKEKIEGCDSCS